MTLKDNAKKTLTDSMKQLREWIGEKEFNKLQKEMSAKKRKTKGKKKKKLYKKRGTKKRRFKKRGNKKRGTKK